LPTDLPTQFDDDLEPITQTVASQYVFEDVSNVPGLIHSYLDSRWYWKRIPLSASA
jgi:hypothetical protein